MRQTSLVSRIHVALVGIVALAALTMVSTYWISDRADSYAHAINLAGSLRMQTYRLAHLQTQPQATERREAYAEQLNTTWQHPIFTGLLQNNKPLQDLYQAALDSNQTLQTQLQTDSSPQQLSLLLEEQTKRIDQLVSRIQRMAEARAQQLRLVQVIALFAVLLLAASIAYWLSVRVEKPLSTLTRMAHRITQGHFDHRIVLHQQDELGQLAESFNRMSHVVGEAHAQMESRIAQQTAELQRSNTTLQFLYEMAKTIIEQEPSGFDFEPIIRKLGKLVHADDIELCFMTETGDKPYKQLKPGDSEFSPCAALNCISCLKGEFNGNAEYPGLEQPVYRYSFAMVRDQQQYGALVCRLQQARALEPWQEQLMQSVADQFALALSLQAQEDNARRLSLAHERTVIARELHDSLAQALSYLKIQVTRLNRALAQKDQQTMEDVSNELQEGLSAAYRQLRELLTTFRLKVDGPGLLGALQSSIYQLSQQTRMAISLDYQLDNIPLTPNEEIHLQQIIREATQNALNHSQGQSVFIQLRQSGPQQLLIRIEDDGKGIPENPEKLNHYGLAIMQERSKNLSGRLEIANRPEGGTRVEFSFTPDSLRQTGVFAREA